MLNFISGLNQKNRLYFDLSVILLVSVLITLPIIIYGIPGGVDLFQHFQFGQNFFGSIKAGNYYPSWADQPNFGLGDVSVRFYPPLTYYLLSFFRLIAGNWAQGDCLMILFLYFISGVGVYLWTREFFTQRAALAGAIAYIILPYHNVQIYQFAFLAEFSTASIIPFCFLFATRVCRRGQLIDVLGLAFTFGLIILSHLPTTIMLSAVLLIYSLFLLKKENFIPSLLKLSTAVLMSVLLSSFYWVRMVTELDFVKHNSETFRTDYFFYKANFVFSRFLDITRSSYNNNFELVFFAIIAVAIPNLIILFTKNREEKHLPTIGMLAVVIFTIFMVTPLSMKVWELLPTLQKIQFPWRWLILLTLSSAFFAAAGFEHAVEYLKTPKRYLSVLAIGALAICIPFNLFRVMGHYFYYPNDYLNLVVEKNKTAPSYDCWWTIWVERSQTEEAKAGSPRPDLLPEKVVLNNRNFTISQWLPTERTFTLQAGQPGQAQIATMYYPHWQAEVNGQSVEVSPGETGMISFPVPAQESQVKVYFQEPARVITAYYISGFVWLLMFGLLIFSLSQSFRSSDKSTIN